MNVNTELTSRHIDIPKIKDKIVDLISYDPGLRIPRNFTFENERKDVDGVKMLHRSALLNQAEECIQQDPQGDITIFKFDIADFHRSDLAKDVQGNSAGDLVINRFAQRIQEISIQLEKDIPVKFIPGRFGGDEFAILVTGTITQDQIAKIKKTLNDHFPQTGVIKKEPTKFVYGYFDRNGKTYEERVRLKKVIKDETLEVIHRPSDPFEKEIFDFFISQGLALNSKEIKSIKGEYQLSEQFAEFKKLHPGQLTYPKEMTATKQKLEYIKKRLPLLAREINLVLDSGFRLEEQNKFLDFLEKRVVDRLLGTISIPPQEFIGLMSQYTHVHCLDLKLIKEINDNVSYIDGDKAIYNLFNQIKDSLGDDIQFVDISRRGSTFFIGVKSGGQGLLKTFEIKDRVTASLSRIKEIKIDIGGVSENYYVGNSQLDIDVLKQPQYKYQKAFEDLIISAEKDYYQYLIDHLITIRTVHPHSYPVLDFVFPQPDIARDKKSYFQNSDRLINRFFISKRSIERMRKMSILLKESRYSSSKYSRLKEIVDLINKDASYKDLTEERMLVIERNVVDAMIPKRK